MTRGNTEPTTTEPQDELQRARFKRSLSAMNVVLTPYAFEVAYARVKATVEKNGEATQIQVKAIVDDVLSSSEILQGVAESFR